MVIRELLTKAIEELSQNGIENEIFEANLMLRSVLSLSPIELVLAYKNEATTDTIKRVSDMVERRIKGEPLQYILGTQEFMGLEFLISPDVLIPRADTETLVESVVRKKKDANILDICTGSGCIAISLAHFIKNVYITGIDISDKALELAEKNAKKLNVSDRVNFKKCDILTEIPNGSFDIIVSNPPYIKTEEINTLQKEVKDFEPRLALDGGEDGLLFYERIIKIAPLLLKPGGEIYFEIGYDQANDVSRLLEKDFCEIEIIKDFSRNDRVVYAKLK